MYVSPVCYIKGECSRVIMINLSCHTSTPFSHTTTHALTHPPILLTHYPYTTALSFTLSNLFHPLFLTETSSKRSKHRSSLKAVRTLLVWTNNSLRNKKIRLTFSYRIALIYICMYGVLKFWVFSLWKYLKKWKS